MEFELDIQPIFEKTCWRCHGPERPKSHFRLDNRQSALKGGDNGIDIIASDSAKSPLIHYVARLVADMEMPPPGKGEPLTAEQIGLLRAWIDQGAQWGGTNQSPELVVSASPSLRWLGVQGDKAKFREIEGMKEGWASGIEHFSLKQQVGPDETVSTEGRVLFQDKDYQLSMALTKADVGFIRAGAEGWRRYYDDTGGYYPLFAKPLYDLNRDLHLDIGRAWVDFGLTRPNWPQMVLGYEYQFKQGAKSTLEWGMVSPTTGNMDPKNIYPAAKDIDERLHILKFDLTHDLYDWHLEERARVEFYDLKTRDAQAGSFSVGPNPDATVTTVQGFGHVQGMNTVRLERQVRDWWVLTGGYFYSRLEGDASFDQTITDVAGNVTPASFWHGDDIILKRETHMGSASSLFLPMEGLSASLAAQGEWTHQKGAGPAYLDALSPGSSNFGPSRIGSDLDKTKYSGNAGIRFTKIPWTALFAEARLEREDIGLYQEEAGDVAYPFKRSTDSTNDRRDVRAGFDTSPWHWASLTAHYRSGISDTDYDHTKPLFYDGYPGFIRHRKIDSDEALVKLVLHPATWLKTTLTYRLVSTHYSTGTDSATDIMGALVAPAGEILAGRYKAREYGLNVTLTPYQRLYFSGAFTYSDSRTETAQNGISSVVPYKGDVYSLSASASYVLNKSTDLHATYSFSRADYGQNNEAGLPLGLNYTRHGLMMGVTRRLTSSLTMNLRYGFFQYSEPSSGAVNDYTAHGVFATLVVKWP